MTTPLETKADSADRARVWSDCYPPDFDHGGQPLLGSDPRVWTDVLEGLAFLGASTSIDGQVVIVIAIIKDGFVEVHGQYVEQGEPLINLIGESLKNARANIPVDSNASKLLGLDVEMEDVLPHTNWEAAARRIEVDLLSTISRFATQSQPIT